MFTPRIPLKTLETLCRSLGTMLDSGVPMLKALNVVSKKTGDSRCRRTLQEVTESVQRGNDVATACRDQGGYFPDLFCDLVAVSEQSGALPEVLLRLADHYDNLLKMRRTFIGAIAFPVIQLIAAILIIALMILVLGLIGESAGSKPTDMLGFGLLGVSGAITWLVLSFGTIAALFATYFVMHKGFRQQRILDGILMSIPVVGKCMRSFAIARFAWAFYLTQNAGMPIVPSLATSFRATGNGAFQGMIGRVTNLVKEGEELSVAFEQSGLFPEEFLHMIQVAESSGTVPETLHRLSPQFEDQARRSLAVLVVAFSWLVWLLVAGMIIFVIFSIITQYLNLLNSFMPK